MVIFAKRLNRIGKIDTKKNIVITGASRGVGGMLARGLSKNGHHIICLSRSKEPLAALVADITSAGGSASFEVVDMMNDEMVLDAGESIIRDLGRIDVWINNVGVNNHNAIGPSWELKTEDWWREVSLNLYTAFIGTHTAIKLMKDRNFGYIINVGGGGAQNPKPFASAYSTAKTAVVRFTENIHLELQKEGLDIKVFTFNPGFIRNERTKQLIESEVANRYLPRLQHIFKHGTMSNPQDSIDLIEILISGRTDKLAGRYLFSDHKNIEEVLPTVATSADGLTKEKRT